MLSPHERRQVIFTADDFGLSEAVNEGIERAYREGMLSSASLMVGGAAVEDAVRRAKTMPGLRIGLHVVVIEGPSVLPHAKIPALVDESGFFPSDGMRLGFRYFFLPEVRRQLRAEIAAQFRAFAETGLRLDHADAHKHMHLHPTIGRMIIDAGFSYGLPAIRIPCEPVDVMAKCGVAPGLGARAMQMWSRVLRRQAEHVGLIVNDQVFGLAWSGAMTEDRLIELSTKLPDGVTELYFHPAARPCGEVTRLMPEYHHVAELEALCSPRVREAFATFERVAYGDL